MTEENQRSWICELHRVIRKDGYLLISFLEQTPSELSEGIKVVARVDKEFHRTWLGKANSPETYYTSYHTLSFLKTLMGENFQFIGHSPKAVRNHQSFALFKKF